LQARGYFVMQIHLSRRITVYIISYMVITTRCDLWLALHFPALPLDRQAVSREGASDSAAMSSTMSSGSALGAAVGAAAGTGLDDDEDTGRAVIVQAGASRKILACNDAARDAGVRAGLALNTAWALMPGLVVTEFDEAAQSEHLEQLTLLALTWSSRVTPKPPSSILLEIGASLRLFGGVDALIAAVSTELRAQGVSFVCAVAPVPSAALLLARAGISSIVREPAHLDAVLAPIPLSRLMLDERVTRGLQRSGVRTLGALRALPAKPLARRFGKALTDWLYRLDGRLPDPQSAWQKPETFRQGLDLALEAPDTASLIFPLNRLVAALGGFLVAGDLGVRSLAVCLYHHRHQPTVLSLRFIDPTADTAHLLKVAREKLDGTRLPAPVIRLVLEARELAEVERAGSDLFDRGRAREGGIEQVLDRLRARLGREALYTAQTGDDHRPEKAWLSTLLGKSAQLDAWPARPLWLYREPVLAPTALELMTSPERIENGWWDEVDVRRDYYIARDSQGSHFWVYRNRRSPECLWVHGVFA
jgi:protein ImuB